MEKFKDILKELREEKGLTQVELAEVTGVSKSAISRYELGQAEANVSALIKLADFFKVSIDYLVGRNNFYA